MDTVLVFLMGAMVGQIILVIGMNLWEWWEHLDDPEPPGPAQDQLHWDWDEQANLWRIR